MLHIKRILVPIDFRWGADQALRHAIALAAEFDAELHLLHVVVGPLREDRGVLSFVEMEELSGRMKQSVRQHRHLTLDSAWDAGTSARYAVRRHVEAAQGILDYVVDHGIDLVVMGTRGHKEVRRSIAGSTAARVVRRASCSVLTVGVDNLFLPGFVKRILVPVDFSEQDALALTLAKRIARKTKAHLILLHAVEPSLYLGRRPGSLTISARRSVRQAYADLEHFYRYVKGPDVSHRYHVVQGRPAQQIASVAKQEATHLIVQGGSGDSESEAFVLASVAEDVVGRASCPVLTVRGAGGKAPAKEEHEDERGGRRVTSSRHGVPAQDESSQPVAGI